MKAHQTLSLLSPLLALASLPLAAVAQTKTPITLDEFLNATDITSARVSPDGSAVVVATKAPDWQQNRFKEDLWLWTRGSGALLGLTRSGHDSEPQWSPDGRYIAFLSDRPLPAPESDDEGKEKDETSRVWVIPRFPFIARSWTLTPSPGRPKARTSSFRSPIRCRRMQKRRAKPSGRMWSAGVSRSVETCFCPCPSRRRSARAQRLHRRTTNRRRPTIIPLILRTPASSPTAIWRSPRSSRRQPANGSPSRPDRFRTGSRILRTMRFFLSDLTAERHGN